MKSACPTPTIITDMGSFDARTRASIVSDISESTPSVSNNSTKYCKKKTGSPVEIMFKVYMLNIKRFLYEKKNRKKKKFYHLSCEIKKRIQ